MVTAVCDSYKTSLALHNFLRLIKKRYQFMKYPEIPLCAYHLSVDVNYQHFKYNDDFFWLAVHLTLFSLFPKEGINFF